MTQLSERGIILSPEGMGSLVESQRTVEIVGQGREIIFAGSDDRALIARCLKLGTLRRYYPNSSFIPRERAIAKFKEQAKPLLTVILYEQKGPLGRMALDPLLYDGCFSVEEAKTELSTYYKGLTEDTVMTYKTFVPETYFVKQTATVQHMLVSLPPSELMKRPEFRPLFFPAIWYWYIRNKGWGGQVFLDILLQRNLIRSDEYKAVVSAVKDGKKLIDIYGNRDALIALFRNGPVEDYRRLFLLQDL